MILDSNIIIYAAAPDGDRLRRLIARRSPAVSAISYVEVLGYHRLQPREKAYFERFFAAAEILPITAAVLDRAINLRQQRQMGLADALIAATALAYGRALVTRNTADFAWVADLRMVDPFMPETE